MHHSKFQIPNSFEQLNIYAYLSPDPYDEDCCFEFDWVDTFPGLKCVCDDVPLFDEHNIKVFENLTEFVESQFKQGLEYLWPVLQTVNINNLGIAIDILNCLSKDTSIASYVWDKSNPKNGNFHFFASRSLAFKYASHISSNKSLSPHLKLVWHHEIIHLLDHKNIEAANIFEKTTSVSNLRSQNLLFYRIEGVAELIYFLSGHNDFHSFDSAIEAFKLEMKILNESIEDYQKNPSYDIDSSFRYNHSFYSIGPWLVLDYLLSSKRKEVISLVHTSLVKLQKKEILEYDDIIKLVKYGLEIKNQNFIVYLHSKKLIDTQ